MIGKILSGISRAFLSAVLIFVLVLGSFIAYRGSQPMGIKEAHGLTYWQFVSNRVNAIEAMPSKCQRMHFTGFAIAITIYPTLYTYIGLYPDSLLARHAMPDPHIPKHVNWPDVPNTWWSLVESVSWEAWVTPHLPNILPECNLKPPAS